MQITDVRVRKVTKEGKMRAVVSITIDDVFVVHDIKVIDGEKGLFIAMPSRKAVVKTNQLKRWARPALCVQSKSRVSFLRSIRK